MTDFTLAIVNWNTRDALAACLSSIREVSNDFQCQVLVADNASSDGSEAMVRERFPEVTLVQTGANLGFAKGHLPLFERSRGRIHILVNSDVRIRPGCLEAVANRMQQEPDIGVLGVQILEEDGRIQPSCRRFPSLSRQLREAIGLGRIFSRSRFWNGYKMGDFDHRSPADVDQVMGAFFAISRQAIDKLGPLDTDFFMYYEEVDYCLRCKQSGLRVVFEPTGQATHVGGASAKAVPVLTIRRTFRSMRHYFHKHQGSWTQAPLLLILFLDGITHLLHSLLKRKKPLQTAKAYGLGWLDVLRKVPADL